MKNKYIAPSIRVVTIAASRQLLQFSGVATDVNSPVNIGYGGIDGGGTMIPGAREFHGDQNITPF